MVIQNRPISAAFKLCLGILAAAGLWVEFQTFGWNALRLFDTWLLMIAALYYFINALVVLLARSRLAGKALWPMLQGALLINSLALTTLWLIYRANLWSWPGVEDAAATLINFLIPLLIILDWALFSQKGRFATYDPLNWLAFPIIMMSGLLVSASFMSKGNDWSYPYTFLNYRTYGIEQLFWWTLIISALYLAAGYALVVLDNLLGGKISQHIVMPKIKTIVIEEGTVISGENIADTAKDISEKPQATSRQPQAIEGLSDRKSATDLHAKKTQVKKTMRLDITKPKPKINNGNNRKNSGSPKSSKQPQKPAAKSPKAQNPASKAKKPAAKPQNPALKKPTQK